MNAGKHFFEQRRIDKAVATFSRAVEVMPARVEGWINLGSALLESRQYDAASDALQRAIAIDSSRVIPHMLLGDALRMLGKTEQSLQSYRRAVSLQRSPLALNKLACALRSRSRLEEAGELYYEALRKDPTFSLARVNLATMQIEWQRFDEARRQLTLLGKQPLPQDERHEVMSALGCIDERARLQDAIDAMVEHDDLGLLAARMTDIDGARLQVDTVALRPVVAYTSALRDARAPDAMPSIALPCEWPLIESLHMIPLVHSLDEYLLARDNPESLDRPAMDVRESFNMEPAIRAARNCRNDMTDPVQAEIHLRHWHALACKGVEGFSPGHFKYTQNWSSRLPTLARVNPALCSGTFRTMISEIYSSVPPGLLRGAVAFLAIYDLHFFADGNARIGMAWMNRELEWAGLMPALFPRELGFKGALGAALTEFRTLGGDLGPVLAVILRGQQYARDFCLALENRARDVGGATA